MSRMWVWYLWGRCCFSHPLCTNTSISLISILWFCTSHFYFHTSPALSPFVNHRFLLFLGASSSIQHVALFKWREATGSWMCSRPFVLICCQTCVRYNNQGGHVLHLNARWRYGSFQKVNMSPFQLIYEVIQYLTGVRWLISIYNKKMDNPTAWFIFYAGVVQITSTLSLFWFRRCRLSRNQIQTSHQGTWLSSAGDKTIRRWCSGAATSSTYWLQMSSVTSGTPARHAPWWTRT